MSFEAYLKQWMGNYKPINEAKKQDPEQFNELRSIIDSGIGGDTKDPIARTTSIGSIDKILDSLDTSILQKVKSNSELQKILLYLVSPGKVEWLGEYLNRSKKNISALGSDKRKINAVENFSDFAKITVKEAGIKANIYKMYLIFKYAESIPDIDTETNILSYLKNEGIELLSSNEEGAPKYKIGKIGLIDNSVASNEFEVINDAGESRVILKEELKNLLEINPEIAEKAKVVSSEGYRKRIDKLSSRIEETIKKDVAKSIDYNREVISELPNTEDTMERLQVDWKPLIDALGYAKFYEKPIKEKEQKITVTEKPSLRKKNRIREKLMAALRLSLLPPLVNGEISSPGGDYFKLMKRLENHNAAWLEACIKEILISGERIAQFNSGPRIKESSLEEDQLAYLHISSTWIIKYIQSEVDGELSKRDMENAVAKIKAAVQEKEREIKNYYLSKDFNMSNFKGIQLKPDLKLPLYKKVRLAVSEADRIAESPLKNLLKGLGQIGIGLLSTVPINIDQAVAEKSAAQNRAIFNGLFSIIKGGVFAVSKQGGRDFEKGVSKVTNKLRLDAVGLTPYEKGEGPKFYKTAEKKTNEDVAPGADMQVPSSLPDQNMDTLSLAGPGKKKSKKNKKALIPRISTFNDFLKG